MDESQVSALLDAHDGLIAACLNDTLRLVDFIAAYGEFPHSYALDESASASRAILRLFQPRIAFHARVAGVLAGASLIDEGLPPVVMQRLRMLIARYPDFKLG